MNLHMNKKYLSLLLLLLPTFSHASSIQELFPYSHWDLDETSGVRYNASTTAIHLNDNNTVSYVTGLSGNAADFENTTRTNAEHLYHGDVLDSKTGSFTISTWVKFEQFGPYTEYIAAKWETSGNQRGFQFYYNTESTPNALVFDYTSDGTTANRVVYSSNSDPFVESVWYHVAVVVVPSTETATLYVDGASIGTTKTTDSGTATSIKDSTASFRIGSQYNDGTHHYFDGEMDSFSLFTYALTGTQISTLYNSGTPLTYLPSEESSTTSTSSVSVNTQNIEFILIAIFFLISFLFFGLVFSPFKKT